MINRQGLNLSSFLNNNLEKSDTIKMDKKDFVEEHENLIHVLNSPSHEDDKKEAKEQKQELDKYSKKTKDMNKRRDPEGIEKSIGSDGLIGNLSREELVKSHITWNFSNNSNIPISKKGADIKEKLMSIKELETSEALEHKIKLDALKTKIGTEPTEEPDEYQTEGLDISILPKTYSWSEVYNQKCDSESQPIEMASEEVKEVQKTTSQLKEDYNRCVRKYIGCQKEITLIDTMLKNLDDSKVYNLTVHQASILKF
jgi:hypothetical protein